MNEQDIVLRIQRLRNQIQAINIALLETTALLNELAQEISNLMQELKQKEAELTKLKKKKEASKK